MDTIGGTIAETIRRTRFYFLNEILSVANQAPVEKFEQSCKEHEKEMSSSKAPNIHHLTQSAV